MREYWDRIKELTDQVFLKETEILKLASGKVAEAIERQRVIYVFGSGHSAILCEELFYRAGGMAAVSPIFVPDLLLANGAVRSSRVERLNGYAQTFMESQPIEPGDLIFVISTSGRNGVPLDVAAIAKERGAYVIGLTSESFSKSQPSRHSSGLRLMDIANLSIDNLCPIGDGCLTMEDGVSFEPASTIIGGVILHTIFAGAVRILEEKGVECPIFASGNVEGGAAFNLRLLEQYKNRIPLYR